MNLTYEEKAMLAGNEGDLIKEAMRFLVTLGEAYDADRMVDIAYANIILCSSFWGKGKFTREMVMEAVDNGLKVKVPTTFNNWGLWDPETPESIWDEMGVSPEVKHQILWENEIALRMGITPTCTCAPYLNCDIGSHPEGKFISTIESSAIVYFNSVLGARANRDCVASFFAAITGKYPKCGVFLDENRLGNILFDVKVDIKDPLTYGLLGVYSGYISGQSIPVYVGLNNLTTYDFMALSAGIASSGATPMFHIVGETPEAPDIKTSFGGREPVQNIIVTQSEIKMTYEQLSDKEGYVDFVCLGCPHYSIYELAEIAELLEDQKLHEEVVLWICVSPATAAFANSIGYSARIRDSGAILMSGPNFCPLFGPGKPCPEYAFRHPQYSIGNYATDSAKQAFYAKSNLRAKNVFLGSKEQCISAAISGKWKGGI